MSSEKVGDVPEAQILIENDYISANDKAGLKKEVENQFAGLSKQQLLDLEKSEPFWRRLRLILFIGFILTWIGMLVGAVLIIVITPKCPYQPDQEFWQNSCTYRLNAFSFADSTGDGVGDIRGLTDKLEYITDTLSIKNIILEPIFMGQYTNNESILGLITDFKDIDPALGTMDDFNGLMKYLRRKGVYITLTMDINAVSIKHKWFAMSNGSYFLKKTDLPSIPWYSRSGNDIFCKDGYYQSYGGSECRLLDLNFNNKDVVAKIKDILTFWLKEVGVDGILLTNTAFYAENFTVGNAASSSSSNVSNLNKFYSSEFEGQLFTNETKHLLQELRWVFDDVSKQTGKHKVMLVEAGNVGRAQVGKEDLSKFLGPAHGIMSSVLLTNGGAHYTQGEQPIKVRLEHLLNQPPNPVDIKTGLTTATQYDAKSNDLQSLVLSFVLPGFPVVYQGVELSQVTLVDDDLDRAANLTMYPKKARTLVYDTRTDKENKYDYDVYNHVMMPWKVIADEKKVYWDTMKLVSAAGAPKGVFDLIIDLVRLRHKYPTLQWGYAELMSDSKDLVVIKRHYDGHSTILALYSDGVATEPEIFSTGPSCNNATAELIYEYPEKFSGLNSKEKFTRIYVNAAKQGLIMLRC